jgi:hypothetical protein
MNRRVLFVLTASIVAAALISGAVLTSSSVEEHDEGVEAASRRSALELQIEKTIATHIELADYPPVTATLDQCVLEWFRHRGEGGCERISNSTQLTKFFDLRDVDIGHINTFTRSDERTGLSIRHGVIRMELSEELEARLLQMRRLAGRISDREMSVGNRGGPVVAAVNEALAAAYPQGVGTTREEYSYCDGTVSIVPAYDSPSMVVDASVLETLSAALRSYDEEYCGAL